MPELPEVETVRRGLLQHLPKTKIAQVQVLRELSIGHPEAGAFEVSLRGHRIDDIHRRGKYLLFKLNGGAWMIGHLGMSGRMLVVEAKKPVEKHVRVRIIFDNQEELRFEDMRVFGRMWYIAKNETVEEVIPGLAKMGREPFEQLDAKHLKEGFQKRTQAIKVVLLDQRTVAGLGNIYADEALFEARINPLRSANTLSDPELKILTKKIKEVLNRAIKLGGSTLRNYTDSKGVNGNYQHKAWVYGRTGKPCRACGTPIKMVRLAGRSSHYCPSCQPEPKPTPGRKEPAKTVGRALPSRTETDKTVGRALPSRKQPAKTVGRGLPSRTETDKTVGRGLPSRNQTRKPTRTKK
jgi:formamidopyrimidine-DNA glycosylase